MKTAAKRPVRFLALVTAAGMAVSISGAAAATKTTKKVAKTTKKVTKTTKKAASTNTTAPPTSAAAPTGAGKTGLKVTEIQNASEPATWDPTQLTGSSGSSGNRAYPIYGALYYMDSKTKQFVPMLADSFTTTDGSNWTLKLRANVKFHDGTPLNAEAVKAHWERIKDPASASSSRGDMLQVATITVADPLTLRITLTQRNQQLQWALMRNVANFVPSPKAIANASSFSTKPVGAGPYMMKEYRNGDRTVMTANPDWPFWPAGGPAIEELTIKALTDENQRYNNLATNQAQIVFTQFAPLRARALKAGFTYTASQQEGGNTIIFNTARAPYDDARVRQAVQMAIDLKAFKAVNCECDDAPIINMFDSDSPFYDKNQDFPKYSLEAAQKLIDEYVAQENNGQPVQLTIGHFSTTANTVNANFFMGQLSKLRNVRVTLDGADSVQAQRRVIAGQYGMHLWGNLFTDPDELYAALHSKSPANFAKYNNPAADAALNLGRASTTVAERKAAYSNLARVLNFDVPIMFYDRVPTSFLHPKNYSNMVWFNDGILRVDQIKVS